MLIWSLHGSVLYKGHKKLSYLTWWDDCAHSLVTSILSLEWPEDQPRAVGWTSSRSCVSGNTSTSLERDRGLLLLESHFWRLSSWSLLVLGDVKRLLWKSLPIPLAYRTHQMSKVWGGMKKPIHLAGGGTNLTACRCQHGKKEGLAILNKAS